MLCIFIKEKSMKDNVYFDAFPVLVFMQKIYMNMNIRYILLTGNVQVWFWFVSGMIFRFIWFMMLNSTFSNISIISWWSVILVDETGIPGENHRPTASHWQSSSYHALSTPHLSGIRRICNISEWCNLFDLKAYISDKIKYTAMLLAWYLFDKDLGFRNRV